MTNTQLPISNKVKKGSEKVIYDLNERTLNFSKNIIKVLRKIDRNTISSPIISQCIRSGTSIGANYAEADCAESRKDFEHKIGICKKESKETVYWLKLLEGIAPQLKLEFQSLVVESSEFQLIFASIVNKSKLNNKQ